MLKILGDGELTKKLKISAHRFSKSALEKIEQAGGEAVVLPGPAPVVKNKAEEEGQEVKLSLSRLAAAVSACVDRDWTDN